MKAFFSKVFHAVFLILIVDLAFSVLWGWGTLRYFHKRPPVKSPIAVVLMGDFNETMTGLGEETHRRLNHMVDLYNDGLAEKVLCVGGARPQWNVFGSELMRAYLIDAGIPEENVFLERKSYDSRTNWLMAQKSIEGHGLKKAVIVSSPFHLYRFDQMIKNGEPHFLQVSFAPYSLKAASPPMTHLDMLKAIHYQWAAHYAQLLPENFREKMILRLRAQ